MSGKETKEKIQSIFLKSTFWNHWAKMWQFALNFLLTVLLARKLGETNYGKYSLWISICFSISLLTHFGFENIINTFVPKIKHYPSKVSYLINHLILIRIIVLLIGITIYLIISKILFSIDLLGDSNAIIIYLIGYVSFNSLSSLLSRVLISQHRLRMLSIINVGTSLLQLMAVYICLNLSFNLSQIFLVITITSFVNLVLCLSVTFKSIIIPKEIFDLKPLLYFGKNSWLTSLVEFGLGKQIDIILIGYFIAAKSEVGFYNLAISTVIILSGFTTAGLGGVALAVFSEIEKKWGTHKLKIAWESLIKLEYILSVPLIAFLAIYAHEIIVSVYTNAYIPSAPMIKLYAVFFIFQRMLGGGIHITAFYAMEKAKFVLITRSIGGFINLLFNLILIPKYGSMGAITATGVSIIITVLFEYLYARKCLSKSYPYLFILKVSVSIIVALSIIRLIKVESLVSIIFAGVIYASLLILMFFVLKPFNRSDQNILYGINSSLVKYLKIFCQKSFVSQS